MRDVKLGGDPWRSVGHWFGTLPFALAAAVRCDGLSSVFGKDSCGSGKVDLLVFEEMNVQRRGIIGRLFGTDNRGWYIEGISAAAGSGKKAPGRRT